MKNELTLEQIEKYLRDIWENQVKPEDRRESYLARYCRSAGGWVTTSKSDPKLCNDPECESCRYFEQLLSHPDHET